MNVRAALIGLVATAALAAPAPAGEFDKYLPENSQFYVHVRVPKFFKSELVRRAVPMAFDKYGDQLAGLAGMAKQFNPNAPDVPEEQLKEGIKHLSDPKVIAEAFDTAQAFVTDVVVAGSAEGDKPDMVVLVKCMMITAEGVDMISNLVQANPQVQVEKIAKGKNNIYAVTVPQQDKKLYISVPQPGVMHIAMSQSAAEASFGAKGKAGEALSGLMSKEGKDDFVFVAGTGKESADYTSMVANVILGKDLNGTMTATYKDEAKAAEEAKHANEHLAQMADQLKAFLGDKADALKSQLQKSKATASGNTVNATFTLPGAAVETLLKKEDKDKR